MSLRSNVIRAQQVAAQAAAESRRLVDLYEKNATKADFGVADDLGGGLPTGLPSSLPANVSGPIAQGQALFQKAYSAADGSAVGTATAVAALVADLPPGAFSSALAEAVSAGEGALEGAAAGSLFGPEGTAIGAVVGAIVGLFSGIGGNPPAPPEGDFRTTGERYVFPAVPINPAGGFSSSVAYPGTWPDIRTNIAAYQIPGPDGSAPVDPATGQGCDLRFTFGIGWHSPPQTTPTSVSAAWACANAWMGSREISRMWALAGKGTGNVPLLQANVKAAKDLAITTLGSQQAFDLVNFLVDSWYNHGYHAKFSLASTQTDALGNITSQSVGSTNAQTLANWAMIIEEINRKAALDYCYYISNNSLYVDQAGGNPEVGQLSSIINNTPAQLVVPYLNKPAFRLLACPDTTLVSVFEVACLVALGVIPKSAADHAALHMVMGMAWLERRGQIFDRDASNLAITGASGISIHPNFARVVGIISAKIKKARQSAPSVGAETDIHAIDVGAIMQAQDKADNAVPWGFMYAAFIGIFIGYKVLKEMDKDKIDVD